MELIERRVLEFLFDSLKEDSNQGYDIKAIAGKDALMIANKLLRSGLIKDDIQSDGINFHCSISIDGIRAVDPAFIESKSREFFGATGDAGSIWNMIQLLKATPNDFQFCFDLANDLQNQDKVKLLYALFPSKVMVEITLKGVLRDK